MDLAMEHSVIVDEERQHRDHVAVKPITINRSLNEGPLSCDGGVDGEKPVQDGEEGKPSKLEGKTDQPHKIEVGHHDDDDGHKAEGVYIKYAYVYDIFDCSFDSR